MAHCRFTLVVAALLLLTMQTGCANAECDNKNSECLSEIEFYNRSKTQTIDAYDAAIIVCDHNREEGIEYTYEWFKNYDILNRLSSVYDVHIFQSASGSLYFSKVTQADAGVYQCIVSVKGGDKSSTSPPYNLDVKSHSFVNVGPIIFRDFIKVIPNKPKIGDRVYLECSTRFVRRNIDLPNYRWTRKDFQPLPEGHELVDYDRRLIIHNIKPEDEGEYVCEASVLPHLDQVSVFLTLEVPTTPSPAFKDPVG